MGIFEVFENSDISRRAEEQVQELMNETKEIEDRAIKTIAEIDGVSEEYARLRQKEQIGTISEAEKEITFNAVFAQCIEICISKIHQR